MKIPISKKKKKKKKIFFFFFFFFEIGIFFFKLGKKSPKYHWERGRNYRPLRTQKKIPAGVWHNYPKDKERQVQCFKVLC